MRPKIVVAVAATLLLAQVPEPLRAQSENGQKPSQADPCQAGPEGRRSEGNAGLSEKLDRCGGVLKPPSSADHEIEKRPPETGSTPVIPPGQLPNRGEPQ
jgi:hypothetical protein